MRLTLPKPHPSQQQILREAGRFNVVCCGRRYGKTTLALDLLVRPALAGHPVAYFAPTYKMLIEFWRTLADIVQPIVRRISEQERRIELVTRGVIEMWSLTEPNVARGRKYARAVPDEAAQVGELLLAWQQVIRPTLADLRGDAWFLSTPRGENDFKTLFDYGGQVAGWRSWQRPTHDNPHISRDELRALEAELPPDVYAQEVLAQFVTIAAAQFLPDMALWRACQDDVAPPDARTPLVVGLDASVSGDTFAVVAVSRHPDDRERVAVRHVRVWAPQGQPLDYGAIEAELRAFLAAHNVVQVAYDPYQAHYLAQRLSDTVWCEPFSQGADRLEADRQLLDVIVQKRLSHDGDATLTQHVAHADRKLDTDGRRLRIVKRTPTGHIDACVALSMATARCLSLNLW